MSSELERRLREAREQLPQPENAATARAREAALGAIRRPRQRRRRAAALVALVIVAALLGVGLAGASFLREPFTVSESKRSLVIDRTFLCTHTPYGGFPHIEARTHEGVRIGRTTQLPYAVAPMGRTPRSLG